MDSVEFQKLSIEEKLNTLFIELTKEAEEIKKTRDMTSGIGDIKHTLNEHITMLEGISKKLCYIYI